MDAGESYTAGERRDIGRGGTIAGFPFSGIPVGESLIEGRFVYNARNKLISPVCAETGACVYGDIKLGARRRVKGVRSVSIGNLSSPTIQLQIFRMCLSVNAYRKCDFISMDVSGPYLRPGGLKTHYRL